MQDAVELWARAHRGTHGRFVWNGVLKCWQAEFDLRNEDPRLKGWKEGRLKVKPVEIVSFHRQEREKKHDGSIGLSVHYKGVPLEELGVEGVLRWLDEGNTWSGTGRFKSFNAACQAAERHNEELRATIAREAEQNAGLRARDERKRLLGTPWTTVPANITQEK